jgi:hypothetical protein
MGKAERHAKIEQLEKALGGSRVICFVTTDRPGIEAPAPYITKDCVKIIERHIGLDEKDGDTVALYLMSHGGDMDVPWPFVNLLRSRYKRLRVIVPYICHSAATQIVLGCDEIIAGPRAQLSPTDPMLTVKTGSEENAPLMQFGVEDINAFLDFVRNSMGPEFRKHGHEAMMKLMERIKPEMLGSVNRTYRRSRLLIEKMRRLTSAKYTKQEMKQLIDNLTVAYYAHAHCISRGEMIDDLNLPVTQAEKLGIENLIWDSMRNTRNSFEAGSHSTYRQNFTRQRPTPPPLKSTPNLLRA